MRGVSARTPQKRGKFLAQLARHGNVLRAGRASGVERRTLYEWRAADPSFAREWELAIEEYAEILEAEADRRAVEGYVGRILVGPDGTIHETLYFSDNLLMFRLKGLKPAMYKDRVQVGGDPNSPLVIETPEARHAEIDVLLARRNGLGLESSHANEG